MEWFLAIEPAPQPAIVVSRIGELLSVGEANKLRIDGGGAAGKQEISGMEGVIEVLR